MNPLSFIRGAAATGGRSVGARAVAGAGGRATVRGAASATSGNAGAAGSSRLEKLWARQTALDLFTRYTGASPQDWLNSQTHAISVAVKGGPEADLRRTWYLCLAILFGRYRNSGVRTIQGGMFEAEWDITGKAVSASLVYSTSGTGGLAAGSLRAHVQRGPDQVTVGGSWPAMFTTLSQTAAPVINALPALADWGVFGLSGMLVSRLTPGFQPPKAATEIVITPTTGTLHASPWILASGEVGCNPAAAPSVKIIRFGGFNGRIASVYREIPRSGDGGNTIRLPWRRVVPDAMRDASYSTQGTGLFSPSSVQLPALPDDGRLITTGEKYDPRVQNPRPPIDGVSRGSLVALVAQALNQPCFLTAAPPCGLVPLGTNAEAPGLRVYPAGQGGKITVKNGVFQSVEQAQIDALPGVLLGQEGSPQFEPATRGPDGYIIPREINYIPNVRG